MQCFRHKRLTKATKMKCSEIWIMVYVIIDRLFTETI